ncbi:MAG: bifunctional pyr operon transcriptional regulator/uracil phosphoribosyltransferase PyrR [Actinomycetota bacterium]|nr:bifunctional pyr operon transcriptional regulator/uracil phosphoribosyltransferase PyrR [Actinomycetota bacterium]
MPSSEFREAHTELGGYLPPENGSSSGHSYSMASVVMTGADVKRVLSRIAHEVVEHNRGCTELVVVGLQTGGVWIAEELCNALLEIATFPCALGSLDVSLYRDDHALRPLIKSSSTDVPVSVKGETVLLVDDVLFTGRTVRAALEAILGFGRPKAIQLAVMVDRGHRELPIRPDYVGKNLPTSRSEMVEVTRQGVRILKEVGNAS